MNKFFQKTKGAISIFLALVMLPMFTCAGLIVDGARISAARTAVTGAGDLAMNSALSEYEKVLFDVYGLFAMSETTEDLEKNVSRYFSNTINNEGIMQDSDSYTRSFINSIGSWFSTDDVSFDNIIDTKVESFDLVEVPNSALANPTVLERQIVEYMKYRGPVSIGTGLLTKLGCIGETSKQTKALEAKVDYEKKLDTVQEACETAYAAINSFNDTVSGTKFEEENYMTKMAEDIASAKEDIQKMTEYIVALRSDSLSAECLYKTSYGYKELSSFLITNQPLDLFKLDSNTRRSVTDHYDDSEADNKIIDTLNYIESSLTGTVTLVPLSDGTYDYAETDFAKALVRLDSYYRNDLPSQINAILLHNDVPGKKTVFTYTLMYTYYYEQLTEEQRTAFTEKNEAYCMIAQILLASSDFCSSYRNSWESSANEKGRAASEKLYNWYSKLGDIETKLTDAIEALDTVIEKSDELDSSREVWNNKVNNLSDSEIKSSMESDYTNSAKNMNKDAIVALKTVLEDNKSHFSSIKSKLDGITFYDKKICISDYSSTDYYARFSSKIPENDITSASAMTSTAANLMSNYVSADVSSISPATFTKITEDQQFYKYLKNICGPAAEVATEEQKEDAKGNRTELINQGNASKDADVTGITTGSYITESGLTSDISAAIESLAQGNDAGADSFDPTSVDSESDDDKMAEDSKANLTKMSNLLEGFANIAETARDYVYLEEYFTEMFSCYTTGKGKETDTKTLGRDDMTGNKFFGSEMEYILYGKDTVEANLNCMKATIFGVRFALNSIYALTSSDTRTPALTAATAIAGWTGFGVPIVQTVILLAWSMAESFVDLNNLCSGEPVALYKSSETWVLGINGAIQLGKDAANAVVDDVFTKIENTAVDAISDIETTVTEYVEDTTRGLVENIQSRVMTSFETLATQIVGESNYNLTEADVREKVDNLLNSMEASASGDSVADRATRLAIDAIKTIRLDNAGSATGMTARDYLVSAIFSIYSDAKEGLVTAISSRVESMLNYIVAPIRNAINGAVSSVGETLKTEVSGIIREGGDMVKERVNSAIDNYLGDLGGGGGGSAAIASGFSLTYKEYVKAFMLLFIIANKTPMLQRCAELIQANVSQKNASFDISKAYTMIEVNATVSIKTTFFSVPISSGMDANGNPIYDLDFSKIGSDRQIIKYIGILGY